MNIKHYLIGVYLMELNLMYKLYHKMVGKLGKIHWKKYIYLYFYKLVYLILKDFTLKSIQDKNYYGVLVYLKLVSNICAFKKKYISTSTLPQYLTLLQLEKYKTLTLVKIATLLGCHIDFILKDISGLVFNPSFNPNGEKTKGLILGAFNEKTKDFKETDEISFNKKFTQTNQKFQTLPVILKKSEEMDKKIELEEEVNTKRYQNNILQCIITRIIKY